MDVRCFDCGANFKVATGAEADDLCPRCKRLEAAQYRNVDPTKDRAGKPLQRPAPRVYAAHAFGRGRHID